MTDGAKQTQKKFKAFLLQMAEAFAPFPSLRDQEKEIRAISETVDSPFTLAVFGRMKTGKSSIINALIGRPLTITGVEEATATLNWISYGDETQRDSAVVHWRDGQSEPIPLSRLSEWTGKDPEVLERVSNTAYLELFANDEFLKDIQIVDTPGTGSVADEHEQIAKEFLSPRAATESNEQGGKADALLYVFPPVARASDQDSLAEFRKTRLPGSDPYNSIGVLHKWDGLEADDIEEEAQRKAARLQEALNDIVSEVVPVSAPLELVARDAPDSFLEQLLELTTQGHQASELGKALRRDNRWDQDEHRASIRRLYPVPWVSFVRIVKLLMRHSCSSVADAKTVCLEGSGFKKLAAILDARFFKRAALIKQRLTRVKAKRPIELGLMKLNKQLEIISTDRRHYKELTTEIPENSIHSAWLQSKLNMAEASYGKLEERTLTAGQRWLEEEERMSLAENDLNFLEAIHHKPDWIEARDRDCILTLLDYRDQEVTSTAPLPKLVLEALVARYAPRLQSPHRNTRHQFEHLIARIQEELHRNVSD